MKHFKYDMIGAYVNGHIKMHPQKDMERLGFALAKSEPVPIADCWWFRCDKYPDEYPDYIIQMRDDFKFSDEE